MPKLPGSRRKFFLSAVALVSILFVAMATYASMVEITAIGKIESVYRDRVTMRIIKLIGSETASLPVSEGSWISFDLPRHQGKSRNRRNNVGYGSVVEAALIGNITTEYEVSDDGTSVGSSSDPENSPVLLWTAQSVVKVKKPNLYLSPEEKSGKKGRKGRRDKKKDKKPAEPVKIWTQEETVRGVVNFREKEKHLFIKEPRMGKRDKGLDVVDDAWYEKLKSMHGQKIVIHGVTHRTSVSSGTIEIKNILKVYPK